MSGDVMHFTSSQRNATRASTSPVKIAAISFCQRNEWSNLFYAAKDPLKDARVGISLEFTPSCRASKKLSFLLLALGALSVAESSSAVGEIHLQKRPPRFRNTARLEAAQLGKRGAVAVSIRISASRGFTRQSHTLCPDAVEYWMALGEARRGSGQQGPRKKLRPGARSLSAMARSDPACAGAALVRNFRPSPGWARRRSESRPGEDRKQFPPIRRCGILRDQRSIKRWRSSAGLRRRPEPCEGAVRSNGGGGALAPRATKVAPVLRRGVRVIR